MSSVGESSRVLRSASRSASAEPVSHTPATRSRAAPRSRGGRRSRTSATPAINAAPPDDDESNLITNRAAYGAEGVGAGVQLQAAEIAQVHAVNPIQNAVTGAEGGLQPLAEESESDDAAAMQQVARENAEQYVAEHVRGPQTPQHSLISRISTFFWGPRDAGESDDQEYYEQMNYNDHHMDAAMTRNFINEGAKWATIMAAIFVSLALLLILPNFTALENKLTQQINDRFERLMHTSPTTAMHDNPSTQLTDRVNWFQPGFHAWIDHSLSSPTATYCDPLWKPWPISRLWSQCKQLPLSPSPRMALQPWEDPMYDRWCAPSSGGLMQLTVEIMRPILPTELVVEYMAKDASPIGFMATAPKEVELWIQIKDAEARHKYSLAMADHYGTNLWWKSSPQGRSISKKRELGEEWVPVGRWMYDIHAKSNIQGFKILAAPDFVKHNITTDKLAVRVNSNWGDRSMTCVNRFQMFGLEQSKFKHEDFLDEGTRGFDDGRCLRAPYCSPETDWSMYWNDETNYLSRV